MLRRAARRVASFSTYVDRSGYTRFSSNGPSSQRGAQTALLLLVGAGGVYVTHRETVPITGRAHAVLISQQREAALGAQAARETLAAHAGRVLPSSHPQARRVARVGARLVEALKADPRLANLPQVKGSCFQFTVLADAAPNAFVAPGGAAFVHTGLLELLPEDDALAAVLAHELAHVVCRHGAEKMTYGLLQVAASVAVAVALGGGADVARLLTELGFGLPFSRAAETEADRVGMVLAARACYDAAGQAVVFQRLEAHSHGHGAPPAWLSTHPTNKARVRAALAAAAGVVAERDKAGCGDRAALLGTGWR